MPVTSMLVPGDLPHVDKRLVEIARALATQPAVLLLDEPAAGLSLERTRRGLRACCGASPSSGVTVVLVEHDMAVVMGISDRVVVLDAGLRLPTARPWRCAMMPGCAKRISATAKCGRDRAPFP